MPNQNELETKIQELETQLQAKERELKIYWEDKEKFNYTEEEIKEMRKPREKDNKGEKNKSTKTIWNSLVKKYQKKYPEQMKIIDISDLTELALQVNDKNIHDYEFLKYFCPEEPKAFFEICKGLKYWILDQLANRILARCLIEKYDWGWSDKSIQKIMNHLASSMLLCEVMENVADVEERNKEFKQLKREKEDLEKELNTIKTEQKTTLENMEKAIRCQEQENWQQAVNNLKKEKTELASKIAELEQTKEQIRQQVLAEKETENNQLRDKINRKLEKGGLFTPSEKGKNLEEATENLLEKQRQLENQIINLKNQIQQKDNESERLKDEINRHLRGFNNKGKDLREATHKFINQHCENKHQIKGLGDKCLEVAATPFNWVANKVGTGFALFGFITAIPTICGALGWALKAFVMVKTSGAGAAVMAANSMINHQQNNQGGNLSPNYQPLPEPEKTSNLPPVTNNHSRNKRKKKRTDNF